MKPTDKAALWGAVGGLVAGGVLYWLLPGAAWWVPVAFGALVAGGLHHKIVKDMAAARIADGELASKNKG